MKCSLIRGLRASQPRPAGRLGVTYLSTPEEAGGDDEQHGGAAYQSLSGRYSSFS